MTGIRRPNRAPFFVCRLIVLVLLLAAAFTAIASAPLDETDQDVRLRLEWTGDKAELWAGILETSQGAFSNSVSLNAGADRAGTLGSDGQGLWFSRRSRLRDDGFEVTLRAPRGARICFTLQTEVQGGWRRQFEWKVAEIGRDPIVFAFGDRPGRLIVRRAPGDELRVSVDRPHLIYRPGEIFKAVLSPDLNSIPGALSGAKLDWEIRASRTDRIVSRGSLPSLPLAPRTGRPQVPIEFPLPDDEGSFDLCFHLKSNASAALESVVQVLVLADRMPAEAHQATIEVVDYFRPANTVSGGRQPVILTSVASMTDLRTPQSLDGFTRHNGETWDTFYVRAQRAAEVLRASADNCLVLTVFADGSTIYPSAFVERSLCLDSRLVSSARHDPLQKDVVELLYRIFDRNGLVLIPELQFACTLTALERELGSGESAAQGIELVGPDGRSWREAYGSNRALKPYYNPLDPRVQNAVLDVVREFVDRYHRHSSYRGIALEIDPRSFLQFPGIEWGCDNATLARFQHDTGVRIDDRAHLRSKLLNGEPRSKWIAWRCAELAKFYRRLAGVAAGIDPQAQLILDCKQVLTPAPETSDIRDANPSRDLLAQQGLDGSLLEGTPHLVMLRHGLNRAASLKFDRRSHSDSIDQALAPVEKTPR